MDRIQLAETEYEFAEIIWEKGEITSGDLVQECEAKFGWKKSTTYTVLSRLCKKGVLKNENAVVTAILMKEEYDALQTEQFINQNFSGSLPRFLAAFMSRKKLSEKQIQEIQEMIANYEADQDSAKCHRKS